MGLGYDQDRWDDHQMLASARVTGAAAAALADYNSTGIWVWRYINGKELFFSAQTSHAWKGTTLHPHVHWVPDTTETYTGTWTMDYIWTPVTVGAAVSTKQTVTGAISGAKTAYQNQHTDLGDIDLVAPTISSILQVRLALALSAGTGAFLFGFDMHFQKARPGTINEATEP